MSRFVDRSSHFRKEKNVPQPTQGSLLRLARPVGLPRKLRASVPNLHVRMVVAGATFEAFLKPFLNQFWIILYHLWARGNILCLLTTSTPLLHRLYCCTVLRIFLVMELNIRVSRMSEILGFIPIPLAALKSTVLSSDSAPLDWSINGYYCENHDVGWILWICFKA